MHYRRARDGPFMKKKIAQSAVRLSTGIVFICLLTMLTYWSATKNQFVWDDYWYLNENLYWLSQLNAEHIIWMLVSLEVANWHPMTWLSWAVDYQIYSNLDPWGYHLSSIVLHAINAVLVFVVTLVVFGLNTEGSKGFPMRTDNNAVIAALFTSLIFGVHPLHVESVAWVSERKDLLFQFFLLVSMLLYVKYAISQERTGKKWIWATLCTFAMALSSKPMAVTFPVIMLLIDVYPLRRTRLTAPLLNSIQQESWNKLIIEKLPFFLLSALVVIVTIHAQQGAMGHTSLTFDLRVINAFNSIVFYLQKFFLPIDFAALYPFAVNPDESLSWTDLMPVLGTFVLFVGTIYAWTRGQPGLLIAFLVYLVALTPVLGLIQVGQQGAADRYTYFPMLPVYLALGSGLLLTLKKIKLPGQIIVITIMLVITFALVDKTKQQIQVWQTDETIWAHAVNLFPDNAYARLNYGITYYELSEHELALAQFEAANSLMPNYAPTLSWLGVTSLKLGHYKDAILYHVELGGASETSDRFETDQYCIQYNIGVAYAHLGMLQEAKDLLSRVERQSTQYQDATAWLNIIETFQLEGKEAQDSSELPEFCVKHFLEGT
jgi:NADH:ubiquinone oxidoreductase subunit 3 (subunit A)